MRHLTKYFRFTLTILIILLMMVSIIGESRLLPSVYASNVVFSTSQLNGDWGVNSHGAVYELPPTYQRFTPGLSYDLSGDMDIFADTEAHGGVINGRCYGFGQWVCTGSISVDNISAGNTKLHVNGPGTVMAIFYRWDFTISVSPSNVKVNPGDEVFFDFNVTAIEPVPDGQRDVWENKENVPAGWLVKAGQSVTLSKNHKTGILHPSVITTSDSSGPYTFQEVGHIDFTSSQYWRRQNVTVTVQKKERPDLIVTNIRTDPPSPNTGDNITIYSTIKNNGPGDLTSEIRVAAWVDRDSNIYLGNFYVSSLTAGNSIEKAFDTTWVMTAGSHEISVMADAAYSVNETDEDNNWAYLQIGGPKPNINTEITLTLNPNNHQPDDRFSITMSGQLTRKDTGAGIPDRPVELDWPGGMTTAVTNSSGYYSYTTLVGPYSPGTYDFTASYGGDEKPTENLLPSSVNAPLTIMWPKPTYEIDVLVSDYSVYILGAKPRLRARVKNLGTVVIGAYELEANFSLVDPDGNVIFAGTGSSTNSMDNGQIDVIENTDNSWTIPTDAKAGWYTLRVTVNHTKTSTVKSKEAVAAFGINSNPPPDYWIAAAPDSISLDQGQTSSIDITVMSISGYNGEVSLSTGPIPRGVSASFSTDKLTPTGTCTLTISASTQAATGTFDLSLVASDGTHTHTCVVTAKVNPSTISLTISQMKTDKASYSGSDPIVFTFDVTNGGTSSVSFRPVIEVQNLGLWSMPDYYTLTPAVGRSFSFTISYEAGWPIDSLNWRVYLVGPPPSDSCTYADSGFTQSFTVTGGTTYAVKIKAVFLPAGLDAMAALTLDSTIYHLTYDGDGTTIRLASGSHKLSCYIENVISGGTYVFSHWVWDSVKNTVIPANETSDLTTITVTGDGELTAVFVQFIIKLSYPKYQTLEPGQTIRFNLTIDCLDNVRQSTVYVNILVQGPTGAIFMGLTEPTLQESSGIQPYIFGTSFSFMYGPVTSDSIPGTYTVWVEVYDRPTADGRCLSLHAELAFTVDVGISYVEVDGPNDHRIIHVHYCKEDVALGGGNTIRDRMRIWDLANLVVSVADLKAPDKLVSSSVDRVWSYRKDIEEFIDFSHDWYDTVAADKSDGSYDYTIIQTIGERGKFYEETPVDIQKAIIEETAWKVGFLVAGLALGVLTGGAALPLVVGVVMCTEIGLEIGGYLFSFDTRLYEIGSPAYDRLVPASDPSQSSESVASADVSLLAGVSDPIYSPVSLPFKALSPMGNDTAAKILTITPSQVISAVAGSTITITVGYEIAQACEENQVNQLMLICDFNGFPPRSGSYFSIYCGIPPESGITGSQSIQIHIPNKPGSYYCWFGLAEGDDLERASKQFKADLIIKDPQMRIDVSPSFASIPGATSSSPALICYTPELYMVVRGTDNGIYYKSTVGGSWSDSWTVISGATNDVPAIAILDNKLHLVVRGTDNGIYHRYMNITTGVWSDWTSIPGATASSPALATSSGTLHLVVRGTDNGIYYKYWNASNGWSAWLGIPGSTNDVPAMAVLGNKLHLVVRGTDNGIYHKMMDLSSKSWTGWTSIGGATLSSPSIAASGTDRLDLVVRGTDNGIYHKVWSSTSGWSSWEAIPGATNDRPALAVADDKLYIIVRGTDNGIYVSDLLNGTWSGWNQIIGATQSYPVIATSSLQVSIAVRGTDNGIYHAYYWPP